MYNIIGLKLRMYLAISIVFAVGFGVLYVLMLYMGAGLIPLISIGILFFLLQWYISPKMIALASHLKYLKENEYP